MNASMASRPTESLDASTRSSDAIPRHNAQVRILAFDGASNADYIFSVTNAVVMTYFALEILANCTVHYDSYFFGVYYIPSARVFVWRLLLFWMSFDDLRRHKWTASMIFDVHWLDGWRSRFENPVKLV